jgi:hypothetical protein
MGASVIDRVAMYAPEYTLGIWLPFRRTRMCRRSPQAVDKLTPDGVVPK